MLGASKILSNPKKAVNSHGGKIYAIDSSYSLREQQRHKQKPKQLQEIKVFGS